MAMKRLAIAACILLGSLGLEPGAPMVYAQGSPTVSKSMTKAAAKKKKKRRRRSEPKQKAPTSDRITEIQEALARNGAYQGDPTGKWDPSTVAAMEKFQGDHGLDATGKIDALTLQKLGLGSDIAGAFAPRPVTPPGKNVAPPSVPAAKTPATTSTSPKTPGGPAITIQTPAATPGPATSASANAKPVTPPQPQ